VPEIFSGRNFLDIVPSLASRDEIYGRECLYIQETKEEQEKELVNQPLFSFPYNWLW
jgi:hypothetical protein